MRWLVALCVRHFGAASALSLLALVLGCLGAQRAQLDVFPDFVPTTVDIQTEAPGFAPEQVEELITRPIENALNGSPGLATLRSESIPGLSVVTITFKDGEEPHLARQGIAERLAELGSTLPAGAGTPRLSPLVSSTMDLLKIGLVSDKVDPYTLRDAADWLIKPRLLAVPGVAHAIVFGGKQREIVITPDLQKLQSYGLTLTDIADAARAAVAVGGAGFVDLSTQRVLLKTPVPEPSPDRLGSALLTVRNSTPLRLRDVATIEQGPALRSGDTLIMGKPGVLLSLASQYGANTLTTTLAVEEALKDLQPALQAQGITLYSGLHRPANFIESALGHLERSLEIAALLILVVLYVFLRNVRAALIAFTAIPLSLLAAVLVLDHMGQTLNTMTLGGFAVALGVLVDDAIIGIENILRRLGQNARLPVPRPRLEIILEASLEVRGPVLYATAVVIAVFIPELLTSSVQGHFVGPLALSFVLAVTASLIVALTATPALCALMLRTPGTTGESRWLLRLKEWQGHAIRRIDRRLGITLGVIAVVLVGAAALVPFLGGTFMPDFREGHFVIQASSTTPGTSLDEMLAFGRRISKEILALPYVQSVEQQVGRAEAGEDTWGPHQSELHVELRPGANNQAEAQEALRKIVSGYPGIESEVVTFLGDRISESLSGETAQVAIKVFGEDLHALDDVGDQIVAALSKEPGVTDLQFKHEDDTPTLRIDPEPARVVAAGLKTRDILDTVDAAYSGAVVGQTYSGVRTVPVVMRLPDSLRNRPEQLGKLPITGSYGPVPLGQVARLDLSEERYSIQHDGGQRRVSVTFNVSGRSLQDAVNDARQRIANNVRLPAATFLQFTGAAEAERQTRLELLAYSGGALVLIVMILLVCLRWRANGWLVMANLPFSLLGSILAIAASGIGLSLGSLVGLVTVFGISARNAILQLAHYEHMVEHEGATWDLSAAVRGANERLTPILMTAVVTALGLAPLAVGINSPGQEIEAPMAITVLGGLVSSTLLNLIVLPVLAHRHARPRPSTVTVPA
ncbi:MAG TPA: efflux RND transporter permease subunit [Steroidobacteraceae bacterium]|nr:efflux RND transporter permease subunit [Steroidobacteraceae bacterium]